MLNLYAIQEDQAILLLTPCFEVLPIPDEEDTVLAYARDAADAHRLADRYAQGDLQPDNVLLWTGQTVAALMER